MHVGLVVRRAPGEDPPVADDRLEGRRLPLVERVDRLDVVVAVDEDRGRPLRVEPVGVDDGVPAGLRDLHVLEAGRGQLSREPLGRPPTVGGVGRDPADARDAQEVDVAGEPPLRAGGEMRLEGAMVDGHGKPPSGGHGGRSRDYGLRHGEGAGRSRPLVVRTWTGRAPASGQAGWAEGSAGAPVSLGTTPWIGSFGGRSLKSASNSSASRVSFSTSVSASRSSFARCWVRTSWARA